MKQTSALVVGLFAIGLAGISSASAQPGYGRYSDDDRYYDREYNREYGRALSPYDAVRVLRRAGFSPLSAPARRGNYYVVIAAGREGNARVYVNVYGGEIAGVRPVGGYQYYGARQPLPPRGIPYGQTGAGPRYEGEPDSGARANNSRGNNTGRPVPPQAIKPAPKSPRVATAPATGTSTTGPTASPRPPVPRPRPAEETKQPAATTTAVAPPTSAPPASTKTAPAVVAAPTANPPVTAKATGPASGETTKGETTKGQAVNGEAAKGGTVIMPVAPLD